MEQPQDKAAAFESAKYYDCRDPEVLDHTEVAEALEDMLDTWWDKDKTPDQVLAELVPIEVKAYNPVAKSKSSIIGRAESVLEDLEEHFMEDYGNMDGDYEFWSKDERAELLKKLEAVFEEALDKAGVWQCEVVASREFSAEEVKEILPEWFEDS
jgi:hypothetical protein